MLIEYIKQRLIIHLLLKLNFANFLDIEKAIRKLLDTLKKEQLGESRKEKISLESQKGQIKE